MGVFIIGERRVAEYLGLGKAVVKKLARTPGFPAVFRRADGAIVTTKAKLDRWADTVVPEPGGASPPQQADSPL